MSGGGLEVRDVSVSYDDRVVLRDVRAELPAGALTSVTGPSGSGKSTLLRVCNGLVAPASGTVALDGADTSTMDAPRLRRLVGLVSQKPAMLPGTVADNVRYGEPDADVDRMLALAGLTEAFADREARRLSGGEQARVAIARALALAPRVLLLDEATAPLDADTARRLGATLRGLAAEGLAVALATHDLAFAAETCDSQVALPGPA